MPRVLQTSQRKESLDVTTNKTLALTDSGLVQNVTADAVTITLPAIATTNAGATFVIRAAGVKVSGSTAGAVQDESQLLTIAVTGSDKVVGGGSAGTATKGISLLKATSEAGAEITLVSSGANASWFIQSQTGGTWTQQA